MGRAPCCDKDNVKRGPWSPEEDSKLKSYIQQNGTGGNWIALPQKVGLKRCGKSCRLRWLNYLRPNIKHGGFSEEEDNIICSLYISIGSRWSIIAAQLPGRTDNDIKNYWNTRLRKKLLGKRKEQYNRRLAAAARQAEVNDLKRYVPSEANTGANVYVTQPTAGIDQQMNMNMSGPYASFGSGIVPQLYEQTACCAEGSAIVDTSPTTKRFELDVLQGFDQQMFVPDNNTSFRKLIEKLEATLIDRSSNMNMMGTSEMEPSNSFISNNNKYVSHYIETEPTPPLDYARCMENPANLERPAVLGAELPINDGALGFSANTVSCGSPDGNYQSAWMNTSNAETDNNENMGSYILPMDWNDLLYCTNNNNSSEVLQQRGENYGCGYGSSVSTMDISGYYFL